MGNRLSTADQYLTTTYGYDESNRLTNVNGTSQVWDANGNLLNDGVNSYNYDSANRLISIVNPQSEIVNGYNGLGDRLQQTTGGQTTSYVLDLNAGLTQVLDDSTNTYLYGNGRIAQVNTTTEYFLSDALGSVRQMSSASGNVVLAKSYDPYGVSNSSSGTAQSNYGFTGEMSDTNTGMVYLRSRYYAPGTGRFMSRDTWDGSADQPMSFNRWDYTEGNPVNSVDPSGHYAHGPYNPRDLAEWMVAEMRADANDFRVQNIKSMNTLGHVELASGAMLACAAIGLELGAGLEYAKGFLGFYDLVKDHGPFDVKHKIKLYLGPGIAFRNHPNLEFSDTGNILFGFIGAAIGYPDEILYRGAGIAEIKDPIHVPPNPYVDNISPSFGKNYLNPCSCRLVNRVKNYLPFTGDMAAPYYGDTHGDYNAVTFGIQLYKSSGPGVTLSQFLEKLNGAVAGFDTFPISDNPVQPAISGQWPYPAGFFDPTK